MITKIIKIIPITIILFSLLITPAFSSQSIYIQKESFLIPWGDDSGEISSSWFGRTVNESESGGISYPGPSSINRTGGYVVYYGDIVKYSPEGDFIAEIDLNTWISLAGKGMVDHICVANGGEVLATRLLLSPNSSENRLFFLNSSLELIAVKTIPGRIFALYPSINGGFWVRYRVMNLDHIDDYYVECNTDGSMSTPILLFSGWSSDPSKPKFKYISPDGQLFSQIVDKYGYIYGVAFYGSGHYLKDQPESAGTIKRYSPSDELVYEHQDIVIENWNVVNRFFPTWDGDFYHQYGTPDGIHITRFELNLPPDCFFFVTTLIPPGPVPAPFAVTFDGTRTRDPNNDTLTFEWDFDGDGVFSEPVDDAYTGPPNNPTHLYYADFDGNVTMRVRDPYDGECTSSVHIHVDIV